MRVFTKKKKCNFAGFDNFFFDRSVVVYINCNTYMVYAKDTCVNLQFFFFFCFLVCKSYSRDAKSKKENKTEEIYKSCTKYSPREEMIDDEAKIHFCP